LEKLPRTPLKFHYIFNLRDISRVFQGLYISTVDKFKSKGAFIRLWRNECSRVFGDRLINSTDVTLVGDDIAGLTRQHFKDTEEEVLANPMFFGDFALSEPGEDTEDPRLYEDLGAVEKVKEKLEYFLSEYNDEKKAMDLNDLSVASTSTCASASERNSRQLRVDALKLFDSLRAD